MAFRFRRGIVAFLLILVPLVATQATAQARTNVAVGLGDQSAAMFSAPAYQALGLKKTRYFVGWDAASRPHELAKADAFVADARKAHVSVLMHISDPDLRRNRGALPSVAQYRTAVGRLVRRYRPQGVSEWGVWNEANHDSQATFRNPARAAQYFVAMRGLCRGCTVVALDILDQRGATDYVRRWYAAVPPAQRRFVTIVGIHNYSDTNRERATGTAGLLREVKRDARVKTAFWLTETGGIVQFGGSFPCDERRAASRVTYMFALARTFRADVRRLYGYNWQGTDCTTRFDAGLVRLDGTLRPAYTAFKRALAGFTR